MGMLTRAPKECGSWFWDLDDVVEPVCSPCSGSRGA
ncbi:hypothetical protein JO379_000053 [Streptomyces syringium]|uniref:Uncharacterized protein n=1 Tax=Streptomyces syringium TaxID=76729 RepID=A0ABS4XVP7_9ACTN|nr:hypothetical protein [Streptomyces syringium]